MKMNRIQKTAYLFDAIGGIDDRLLADAMQYGGARRSVGMRKVLLLAATLSLSLIFLLQIAVGFAMGGLNKNNAPSKEETTEDAPFALDAVLSEQRGTGQLTVLSSKEEYPFFDGTSRLVWQYGDEAFWYISRPLTAYEVEELLHEMSRGGRIGVKEGDGEPLCRIWLVCDNGEVRSPYLEASDGNVGYADFFDYRAEVIPDDGLISCISDILTGSAG